MGRKIVVVGSSNTDMIIQVEHIPKPGETIIGGAFSIAAGGKGANQAVAAARAGGSVTLVARVGKDMFGKQAINAFVKDDIDVGHVKQDSDTPSGVALIFVDKDGENSIAVASGANANVSPADVQAARDSIAAADILLMQLETPLETIQAATQIASENDVRVILNPAPAQPLNDGILQQVSVLTPNESEAELLTGIPVKNETDAETAANALFDKGIKTVLITLGSKGALVFDSDYRGLVPGFKVEAVDSTAAGDAFNGALAVALAEETPLKDAVAFANAGGALSVTKLGAQPSAPSRSEIDLFLQERT